jgi:hypothetical protein
VLIWFRAVIRELKYFGGQTEAPPPPQKKKDIILCFALLHLKFIVGVLLFLRLFLTVNVIRIPYNKLTAHNLIQQIAHVTVSNHLLIFDMFRPLQAI